LQCQQQEQSSIYLSSTYLSMNFVFHSTVGFSGTLDQMDLLPVRPSPRWWPAAMFEISNDNINGTSCLNIVFETSLTRCLMSAANNHINVPAARRTTIRDWAIAIAGPHAWNSSPTTTHLLAPLENISRPTYIHYHSRAQNSSLL